MDEGRLVLSSWWMAVYFGRIRCASQLASPTRARRPHNCGQGPCRRISCWSRRPDSRAGTPLRSGGQLNGLGPLGVDCCPWSHSSRIVTESVRPPRWTAGCPKPHHPLVEVRSTRQARSPGVSEPSPPPPPVRPLAVWQPDGPVGVVVRRCAAAAERPSATPPRLGPVQSHKLAAAAKREPLVCPSRLVLSWPRGVAAARTFRCWLTGLCYLRHETFCR